MNSTSIFSTVPKSDYLGFYSEEQFNYQKAVDFLNFDKKEVAVAAGIPKSSVRYDQRIPKLLEERIIQWATAINLVADHFEGDINKTLLWFKTINPMLGNKSPRELIRLGLYNKLIAFILAATESNKKKCLKK